MSLASLSSATSRVLFGLLAIDDSVCELPFAKAMACGTTLKGFLLVKGLLVAAASGFIQTLLQNVFAGFHIGSVSLRTLTAGEGSVWSREHSAVHTRLTHTRMLSG